MLGGVSLWTYDHIRAEHFRDQSLHGPLLKTTIVLIICLNFVPFDCNILKWTATLSLTLHLTLVLIGGHHHQHWKRNWAIQKRIDKESSRYHFNTLRSDDEATQGGDGVRGEGWGEKPRILRGTKPLGLEWPLSPLFFILASLGGS